MEYVEQYDIVNLYSTGTLHGLATYYVINCYLLRNCNLSPFSLANNSHKKFWRKNQIHFVGLDGDIFLLQNINFMICGFVKCRLKT